jgi:hypothetical protein
MVSPKSADDPMVHANFASNLHLNSGLKQRMYTYATRDFDS